jgi:hypothetical protein
MPPSAEHPLLPIVTAWFGKIENAKLDKQDKFGKYADEGQRFFAGGNDSMWGKKNREGNQGWMAKGRQISLPTFQININKIFECVALFGPVLYHKNPNALCTPTVRPEIPAIVLGLVGTDQAKTQYEQLMFNEDVEKQRRTALGELNQCYLNWLQEETDKKTHARRGITETIVKGMGVLWTEAHQPHGSSITYPRSVYDSVNNLLLDPDAENWEDITWCARKRTSSSDALAAKYGLDPTYLRRKDKQTHDLITYYEIYSKAGFGHKLKTPDGSDLRQNDYIDYDMFGPFCHLVLVKGVPFPLNLPPNVLPNAMTALMPPEAQQAQADEAFMRAQWPIPFWEESGAWPFSPLWFHVDSDGIWPIALVRSALGEIKWVNWAISFLADKIAVGSRTLVGCMEAAAQDIQDALIKSEGPYALVKLKELFGGKKIDDVLSFKDPPAVSDGIWTMVSAMMELIDKRLGTSELLYGMTRTSFRSATEANVKNEQTAVRPDDMASQVEDWLSAVLRKEAFAAHWLTKVEDVQPVLGQLGAYVWETQWLPLPSEAVVRDYSFRIEAGTARKPNKNNRIAQLEDFGRVAAPLLQKFAEMGVMRPWNAFMKDIGKAMDVDPTEYLVQLEDFPPPPPEEKPAEKKGAK